MERIHLIMTFLEQRHTIHLKELATMLNVSEITVRRDINESNIGLRIIGGYVIFEGGSIDEFFEPSHTGSKYSLIREMHHNIEAKKHIGQIAINHINEDDTVFIDSGSTTTYLIEYLPKDLPCTMVCNSLSIMNVLRRRSLVNIILLGGRYDRSHQRFCSIGEDQTLDNIRISKAFFSCAGFSEKLGVMDPTQDNIEIKKKIFSISQKTYLVADSSKFERVSLAWYADIFSFDTLFTSSPSKKGEFNSLEKGGLNVIFRKEHQSAGL